MTTPEIRVKVNTKQKAMVRNLTSLSGAKNESDYVRQKIFEDPTLHEKLNKIIEGLEFLKKKNQRTIKH